MPPDAEFDELWNAHKDLLRAQVLMHDSLSKITAALNDLTENAHNTDVKIASLVDAQLRNEDELRELTRRQAETESSLKAFLDQMRGNSRN